MKEKSNNKFKSLLATTSVLGMISYASAMGAVSSIPFANADIGNQATLTYQTLGGVDKLVQSNIVITTINQTYALNLEPNRTTTITKGQNAIFNHTLTNLGNGPDSFLITNSYLAGRGVKIYLDVNNNGIIDGNETEIPLVDGKRTISGVGAFETRSILVVVPTSVTDTGPSVTGNITAASIGDSSKTKLVTETINFTANANVGVYKALSSASGASDVAREVTVYLKVYNDSLTAGSAFALKDELNTKFEYLENSATWQDFNSNTVVPLTDTFSAEGITYSVVTNANNKKEINFGLDTVVPFSIESTGGLLSFKVRVKQNENIGTIPNKASFEFNDTVETITKDSNTVNYTVLKYVKAEFTGDTVTNAQAGQEIRFVNVFKNTANAPEIYNLAVADKFFPVGTTFRMMLQSPGQNEKPVLDNNGDGIIDTGIVGINEVINVVLYAQLPQNIANPQPNYTVKKIATSTFTPAYNVNAIDTLNTITAATVDLTNIDSLSTNANAPGKGLGPEASPVTQKSLNPGETTNFVLHVNNTSSYITDTFKLEVSTKPDFSNLVMPTGVSVKFKISGGVESTVTSAILPNTSQRVDAEVSVALNTVAQTVPLYFRVTSLTTGARDTKYDAMTINAIRNVSITPNNTSSTYAGGTVIYTHTVKNNGNVKEGDGSSSNIFLVLSETKSWAASDIFLDTNGNGVFDLGVDTPFGDFATINGLNPGQEVKIFTRVVASIGAPAGDNNITTITPNVSQGTYSVPATVTVATDTTTILAEDLTIIKGQKLSPTENYTTSPQRSNPGGTIYYKIEIKNNGAIDATNVKIKDTVPFYTTQYHKTGVSSPGEGTDYVASYIVIDSNGTAGAFKVAETQPGLGKRGDIIANVGTLKPKERAILYFQVKIDEVPTSLPSGDA